MDQYLRQVFGPLGNDVILYPYKFSMDSFYGIVYLRVLQKNQLNLSKNVSPMDATEVSEFFFEKETPLPFSGKPAELICVELVVSTLLQSMNEGSQKQFAG